MGLNVSWKTSNNLSLSSHEEYWNDIFSYYVNIRHAFAISAFVLIPIIIVSNAVLTITIVTDIKLRKEFRYVVMTSIAVADVLIGLVSCPVQAVTELTMDANHDCATNLLVSMIKQYVHIFVGTWGIVIINFDFLLTLYGVELPRLSPLNQRLAVVLILALPWLALFIVVLPVAFANGTKSFYYYNFCYIYLHGAAKEIVVSFKFVIPGMLIVSQIIAISVANLCRQQCRRMPILMTAPDPTRLSWVLVIAGIITVGFLGIYECGEMAGEKLYKMPYGFVLSFYYIANFISDSKSAVIPLLWFAIPELRTAFMKIVKMIPWRYCNIGNVRNGVEDNVVSYRKMYDDNA